MSKRDYSQRVNVKKFLSHWSMFLEEHGEETTLKVLNSKDKGHSMLNYKDRLGLKQALGLI